MFVGHLALAFVAKRARPSASLGWYIAAVTAADLLWPAFLIVGLERVRIDPGNTAFTPLAFESYPWSHSLLMLAVWGIMFTVNARNVDVAKNAAILLLPLVVSHWVLDVITHAPDMPLWPGDSPTYGFRLWDSIPATFAVEGAMWAIAIAVYLRGRRATSRKGAVALWSLITVTTVMWIMGPFQQPPPSERLIGWFALIGWIVVPWAVYADRRYRLTLR